jgi:hypothetical protein
LRMDYLSIGMNKSAKPWAAMRKNMVEVQANQQGRRHICGRQPKMPWSPCSPIPSRTEFGFQYWASLNMLVLSRHLETSREDSSC